MLSPTNTYVLIFQLQIELNLPFAHTDRSGDYVLLNMSCLQNLSNLCCLLKSEGKCSACKIDLCAYCFHDHFQKNDSEVVLKFLDANRYSYTFHTSMKCCMVGKPAIFATTCLNL